MSLLLDTHAVLWYALDDERLSSTAREAIENESGAVFVSAGSYWEVAIKISIGRYLLTIPFDKFWEQAIAKQGLVLLPIEIRHAHRVSTLPLIHRDPFDRILIAQALCDGLAVISNDSQMDKYGIQRIW